MRQIWIFRDFLKWSVLKKTDKDAKSKAVAILDDTLKKQKNSTDDF